jgi:hypothetical protein
MTLMKLYTDGFFHSAHDSAKVVKPPAAKLISNHRSCRNLWQCDYFRGLPRKDGRAAQIPDIPSRVYAVGFKMAVISFTDCANSSFRSPY